MKVIKVKGEDQTAEKIKDGWSYFKKFNSMELEDDEELVLVAPYEDAQEFINKL